MLWVILSVVFGHSKANNLILENLSQSDFLTSCLNQIIDTFKDTKTVYSVGSYYNLERPTIMLDLKRQVKNWKGDITIIDSIGTSMDELFKRITEEYFFDSRNPTIVITNKTRRSVFKAASKYHIHKLLLLEDQNQTQKIYTYNPYKKGNVNTPLTTFTLWSFCREGQLSKNRPIPKFELPLKWPKTTIRALNNIVPPYAVCPMCPINRGIEIEAVEVIAHHLQLKVHYTRSEFEYWGSKTNGTYSHIYGELQRREGDMTIGVFHSKFDEHLDFDMSYTYMEDSTRWLVPKAKILPYWKRLGLIFAKEVYVSLFCSIMVMAVVCHFLFNLSYSSSWIMLYQILLEVSLEQLPFIFRMVMMIWIGSCLVLSTMFKSKLTDIMSKDSYEHQIDSVADIIDSKLDILIDHDIAKFFNNFTNPEEDYIRRNYKFCIFPRLCINRTAFVQDCVTVDFQRSNDFFLPELIDQEGDLLIHLFKTPIFLVHIHMFFVKGYPIFPQIDDLLMRLRSNGVIKHLYDSASHYALLAMSKKTIFKVEVLGLEQLQVAFVIWSLGVLLAGLVFVGEWFVGNRTGLRKEVI